MIGRRRSKFLRTRFQGTSYCVVFHPSRVSGLVGMDDNLLHTQCRDIAKCIDGLSMSLTELGAGDVGTSSISNSDILKIMMDVHKLIQSFRFLGKYYVGELVKKCKELDFKNREVQELSYRLEQVEGKAETVHTATAEKTKLGEFDESTKDRIHESRQGTAEVREPEGKLPASSDESVSQRLRMHQTQFEEKMRPQLSAKELSSSPNETGPPRVSAGVQLLPADPDPAVRPIVAGEKSNADVKDSKLVAETADFGQRFEQVEVPDHREKRTIEIIELDSDSDNEHGNKCDSSLRPFKTRKVGEEQQLSDVHVAANKTAEDGVQSIQHRLVQEKSTVEKLCKMMEDYQHIFLEKAIAARLQG